MFSEHHLYLVFILLKRKKVRSREKEEERRISMEKGGRRGFLVFYPCSINIFRGTYEKIKKTLMPNETCKETIIY